MADRHHIYLIPGFFGFSDLGGVSYFAHVRVYLEAAFRDRGLEAEIHHVRTLPTSSISRRAARLLDEIAMTAGTEDEPIHLIGHSTGGIDARLVVRPGASFPSQHDKDKYARRVRSVVSVATPHYGTPLAGFFTSVLGQKLLRILSLSTIHLIRLRSLPRPGLMLLAMVMAGSSRVGLLKGGILDTVYREILKDFSEKRRDELTAFFADVSGDQTLLAQLAPEAMELFNVSAVKRRSVRYGCVVVQARPPSSAFVPRAIAKPVGLATYPVYGGLHRIASRFPSWAAPELTAAQSRALILAFGSKPNLDSNDAIVPTLSQVRGEIIHAAWADHLDVIGHFSDRSDGHKHADWLRSMSGFTRSEFESVWSNVVEFMSAT